jgi:hypothetical protein
MLALVEVAQELRLAHLADIFVSCLTGLADSVY